MMAHPFLHIYSQPYNHADAYVVGDRESLTQLRDAIDRALASEEGVARSLASAADGEGFNAFVVRATEQQGDALVLPYNEGQWTGSDPYELIPDATYRKLATTDE